VLVGLLRINNDKLVKITVLATDSHDFPSKKMPIFLLKFEVFLSIFWIPECFVPNHQHCSTAPRKKLRATGACWYCVVVRKYSGLKG